MSVDNEIKLVDTCTRLLGVVVWPGVILFLIIWFRSSLREFFTNLSELSLKAAGIDINMKRRQIEAAAALGAAEASHSQTPGMSADSVIISSSKAAELVNQAITPRVVRRAEKATLLWVDDRPDNNVHERQALEALGLKIVLSTSTDDALQKLTGRRYDVIISDMGRPPDNRAGYTLLEKLRTAGNDTPYIIYAGSRTPDHQAESIRKGALGCTNRANELFELVLSALRRE